MDNIFAKIANNGIADIAMQQQWNELKMAVANHNVIPVIGPNMQIAPVSTPQGITCNAQRVLLNELAKYLSLPSAPTSFSELLYDNTLPKGYDQRCIYAQLTQLFQGDTSALLQPHPALVKLLKTKHFPFVITTCFTPMVENVMKEVWGDKLRVRIFNNDPKTLDDLVSEIDIDSPTVYYMFGKAANPRTGSFVVTDGDMLSFCSSWLDEIRRPRNLINMLQDRYLLMLGTDYSDWLCRFVLHSMKPNKRTGMLAGTANEDKLLHFLRRMDNFIQEDPEQVINHLCEQIESESDHLNASTALNMDVFISYSRRDSEVAEALYKSLTQLGITVWLDRQSLKLGNDFMREIKRSITSAKFFIPILSHSVIVERNESHPYRIEWEVAATHNLSLGRDFIIPLAEEGFDFYSASVPESLNKHNASIYSKNALNLDAFAETVKTMLDELK